MVKYQNMVITVANKVSKYEEIQKEQEQIIKPLIRLCFCNHLKQRYPTPPQMLNQASNLEFH